MFLSSNHSRVDEPSRLFLIDFMYSPNGQTWYLFFPPSPTANLNFAVCLWSNVVVVLIISVIVRDITSFFLPFHPVVIRHEINTRLMWPLLSLAWSSSWCASCIRCNIFLSFTQKNNLSSTLLYALLLSISVYIKAFLSHPFPLHSHCDHPLAYPSIDRSSSQLARITSRLTSTLPRFSFILLTFFAIL